MMVAMMMAMVMAVVIGFFIIFDGHEIANGKERENRTVHGFGTPCRIYTKSVPAGRGKNRTMFLV